MHLLYLPKWSKLNKAGKAPIVLRITWAGVRAAFATGLFTTPLGWNQAKEELRGTAEGIDDDNNELRLLKQTARKRKKQLVKRIAKGKIKGPLTARMVADSLRTEVEEPAEAEPCCVDLFSHLIATHYAPHNLHTLARFDAVLSLLRRWRGTAPLLLSELALPATGATLLKWCDTHTRRGAAGKASLVADLQVLYRRQTNTAAVLWPDLNHTPARAKRRVRLTGPELSTLREAINLPRAQHVARLAYLLAFHLHGSRLGVVLELTWKQVGDQRVQVEIEKGGGHAEIMLSAPLREVLSRCRELHTGAYVLPLLPDNYRQLPAEERYKIRKSKHACVHSALAALAGKLGLPQPLHPHTARHTAAKLITQAHGGDMRPANKLLRHTSMQMTEIYIGSLSDEELQDAVDRMNSTL